MTGWAERDELACGALGAVVLADTRGLSDCFSAVDYFGQRRPPFIVAINEFEGAPARGPCACRDRRRVARVSRAR